jgi:hypothetical protein
MFTDWSQTDPVYFYLRGMMAGALVTLLLVVPVARAAIGAFRSRP